MRYYKDGKGISGIKYYDLLGYHPDFVKMDFLEIGANILLNEAREKEDPYYRHHIPKKAYVFCGGLSSGIDQHLRTYDCVICLFFVYDEGRRDSELNISRVKFNTSCSHDYGETVLGYDIVWKSEKKVPLRWNKSSLYPLQTQYLKTMNREYSRIDPRLEDYVITDRNNHGIEHVICMFYESNKNDFRFKELEDRFKERFKEIENSFAPVDLPAINPLKEPKLETPAPVNSKNLEPAPVRDSKGRFIPKTAPAKAPAKALEVTKPAPVRGSNGRFISSK
jgi:hypothetical protein